MNTINTIKAKVTEALLSTPVYRWFQSKSPSDQRILKGLVVLFVGTLFLIVVWQPINEFHSSEQARAIKTRALADWVALNRSALVNAQGQPGGSGNGRSDGPTIAEITNTAAVHGITLARLQPESDGTVDVSLEQQSFDAVVRWLAVLELEQGYEIQRASIDQGNQTGVINAQLQFR